MVEYGISLGKKTLKNGEQTGISLELTMKNGGNVVDFHMISLGNFMAKGKKIQVEHVQPNLHPGFSLSIHFSLHFRWHI